MARGINKAIIVGNLGTDPEVRYLPDGAAVANITVATSESWTDKATNEKKEATEWHRVTFYGRLAEVVGEYLRKGSKVYIEGKLKTRKWQDKEGIERYTTEINASEMQMLDSAQAGQQQNHQGSQQQPQQQAPQQGHQQHQQQGGYQQPPAYQQPQQGGYQRK